LADEPRSLMDGQTLDIVRETSPVTSFTTTQAVDVPDLGGSGFGVIARVAARRQR
jgi:hypothetical protein